MKHVVVTGISGGIGRAILGYLLNAVDDEGDSAYTIIGVYNQNRPTLEHRRFVAYKVNLQDSDEVQRWANGFGPGAPWAIVNLAGAQLSGMHWKAGKDAEEEVIDANLRSTMHMCRSFSPLFRENGAGRIINVSSVVADMGAVGCSAYAASKAGIEGYTRAIALELARDRVTANCVALGYCNYGMIESVPDGLRAEIQKRIPLGRLGVGSDVAGLLLYLLGEQSGYMTGQTLHLNGGIYLG